MKCGIGEATVGLENELWPESGFFGFIDKCEMCLRVVGANNYIFNDIYKWRTTEILSQILAIFVHFCEILNIRDKNETSSFFYRFLHLLLNFSLKPIQCGQYDTNVSNLLKKLLHVECYILVMRYKDCKVSMKLL